MKGRQSNPVSVVCFITGCAAAVSSHWFFSEISSLPNELLIERNWWRFSESDTLSQFLSNFLCFFNVSARSNRLVSPIRKVSSCYRKLMHIDMGILLYFSYNRPTYSLPKNLLALPRYEFTTVLVKTYVSSSHTSRRY